MREPAGVAPEAQLRVQGAIAEGADQPIWLDQPRVGWSGAGHQKIGWSAAQVQLRHETLKSSFCCSLFGFERPSR